MPNLEDDARGYIESVLGVAAHLSPVPVRVPYTIRDSYKIYELSMPMVKNSTLNMTLLVSNDEVAHPGIVKLQKHIELVHKVTNQVVVYVCRSLTIQSRRSLIMHQVNFIQPSLQMFIPEMALDLRESFRLRREQSEVAVLFPAAQAMLLSCLYGGKTDEAFFKANTLMGGLKYSRVTLSKAVEQLTSLDVITPAKSDLHWKTYTFNGTPAEVFRKAKPYLRSPVRKRVGITRNILPMAPGVCLAGETALAKYTTLAEPQQAVWGMTKKVFNDMLELDAFEVIDSLDEIEGWVEIWTYPSLTERHYIADATSLYLSLDEDPDERIQLALDELKEHVNWLA